MHKPKHEPKTAASVARARQPRPACRAAEIAATQKAKPIHPPRRRRNGRKRDWTPLIVRTLSFIALTALVVFALTSKRLVVRQLDIEGVRTVSPYEVAALANVPKGQNIFRYLAFHEKALTRRILKGEPAVEAAQVGLELPDTLAVRLTERQPYAVLRTKTGGGWLLDSKLVPYRVLATARGALPVIAMASPPAEVMLGKRLPPDVVGPVSSVYTLLDALKRNAYPSLERLRVVTVDPNANLCLILTNGLCVKLGQPDGLASKLSQVEEALTADPSLLQRALYLDFTSPRPAWMPRPPEVADAALKTKPSSSHFRLTGAGIHRD